jgi:hypothetical protein
MSSAPAGPEDHLGRADGARQGGEFRAACPGRQDDVPTAPGRRAQQVARRVERGQPLEVRGVEGVTGRGKLLVLVGVTSPTSAECLSIPPSVASTLHPVRSAPAGRPTVDS